MLWDCSHRRAQMVDLLRANSAIRQIRPVPHKRRSFDFIRDDMATYKRVKLAIDKEDDTVASGDEVQMSSSSGSEDDDIGSPDTRDSENTDDEIADGRRIRSKKTLKRKRRATEPSQFGATLRSLLDTETPSSLPLSLKSSVVHQRNDARLESEAKKVVRVERKEKEERGRIKDSIGGWGGESERSLRKVAQRGVVKLFNTIQQSQLAAAVADEEARSSRGTGKSSLPAPTLDRKDKGKRNKNKAERGVQVAADKDAFFEMIRSGGIVSKS